MRAKKGRLIAVVLFSICLSYMARGTEVTQTFFQTKTGIVTIPLYTHELCQFQCATPGGWVAKLDPSRDTALVFGTNHAFICVSLAPVPASSIYLEEWRLKSLQKELTSSRAFRIQASCFTTIENTTNWLAWGFTAPDRSGTPPVAEYHSYHIKSGYMFHICLIAPASEVKQFMAAFDLVRASFRSREFVK